MMAMESIKDCVRKCNSRDGTAPRHLLRKRVSLESNTNPWRGKQFGEENKLDQLCEEIWCKNIHVSELRALSEKARNGQFGKLPD